MNDKVPRFGPENREEALQPAHDFGRAILAPVASPSAMDAKAAATDTFGSAPSPA